MVKDDTWVEEFEKMVNKQDAGAYKEAVKDLIDTIKAKNKIIKAKDKEIERLNNVVNLFQYKEYKKGILDPRD